VYMWQMVFVFFLSRSVGGPADRQKNKYNLSHIHLRPPDDGLQMGPKHVEAW
jgi:hypothetical protein